MNIILQSVQHSYKLSYNNPKSIKIPPPLIIDRFNTQYKKIITSVFLYWKIIEHIIKLVS